jgi:Kef-type K+ transport system membrane component KefB
VLTNAELTQFLISTMALLIAALSVGYLFERLRMPRVIGEICGGLLLGPSVLGWAWPDAAGWLVPADSVNDKLLSSAYWLGLILLMFTAGFKMQRRFDSRDTRQVAVLLIGATALPFAAGWAATQIVDLSGYAGPEGSELSLTLIFSIAVAVTSIPVISRIFMDLGILETRFAKVVLAASTIQDVLLWAALAVATTLAAAQEPSLAEAGSAAARTLVFTAAALAFGPALLRKANGLRVNVVLKSSRLGYTLVWCLLLVALAAALDVNVIFGAFVAGIVLGGVAPDEFRDAKEQVSSFGLGFFIPLYFAMVGLRIDLPGAFDPALFLGFLAFSTVIEGFSTYAAMRLYRSSALTAWHFAVAMNTRGGPGIVLASVAYDFGLIDARFFVALVLTAIVTSLAAGAWFRYAVAAGLPLLGDDVAAKREPASS